MLVDRKNLARHAGWIIFSLLATASAIAWFVVEGQSSHRWPGGSSRPGLVVGSLAGLIMLFELLLWPRKRLRAWRVGRAQSWLRAHIWLGLLSVPLVVLHSGGELGGQLTIALVVVFAIVIASGLWGLALQQYLPKMMLERVPAETIYGQIEHLSRQNHRDAKRLVQAVCGTSKDDTEDVTDEEDLVDSGHLTVGTFRNEGKTRGKVLETRKPQPMVPNSEPLRAEFRTLIGPYLIGKGEASLLADPARAAQRFQELRGRLDPAAHGAVNELECLCLQRRQFELQRRMHHWLHGWLLIHAPLSVVLLILLGLHIYAACKYW